MYNSVIDAGDALSFAVIDRVREQFLHRIGFPELLRARADFAAAAVTVLTTPGHEGKVYELAGDKPFTGAGRLLRTSDVIAIDWEDGAIDIDTGDDVRALACR